MFRHLFLSINENEWAIKITSFWNFIFKTWNLKWAAGADYPILSKIPRFSPSSFAEGVIMVFEWTLMGHQWGQACVFAYFFCLLVNVRIIYPFLEISSLLHIHYRSPQSFYCKVQAFSMGFFSKQVCGGRGTFRAPPPSTCCRSLFPGEHSKAFYNMQLRKPDPIISAAATDLSM